NFPRNLPFFDSIRLMGQRRGNWNRNFNRSKASITAPPSAVRADRLSSYPLLMRYREPLFPLGAGQRALVIGAALIWCAVSMHFSKVWVFDDLLGVTVPGWNS